MPSLLPPEIVAGIVEASAAETVSPSIRSCVAGGGACEVGGGCRGDIVLVAPAVCSGGGSANVRVPGGLASNTSRTFYRWRKTAHRSYGATMNVVYKY